MTFVPEPSPDPQAPEGGGAVDSVNGQTGVVVLDAGDIAADSTTLAGVGTTVQAVLEELDDGLAALAPLALPIALTTPAGGKFAVGTTGRFASGYAVSGGLIQTLYNPGPFAQGYAAYTGAITSSASGSFAQGYATGASSEVHASAGGSFAQGYTRGGGRVLSTQSGAFAQGTARNEGVIQAIAAGAVASGYAGGADSEIKADSASFAHGQASSGGKVLVNAPGAIVSGYADGAGSYLLASAAGAGAFGKATGGAHIIAQADGSFQFGPGTNALANSLAVGARAAGLRLCGAGLPASPEDGDIWLESNTIKVRLNGATKTVTAI